MAGTKRDRGRLEVKWERCQGWFRALGESIRILSLTPTEMEATGGFATNEQHDLTYVLKGSLSSVLRIATLEGRGR